MVADALHEHGRIQLATLLTTLVDSRKLRAIAKRHGLSPKGYRVERAPADKLASLLGESSDADLLAELCQLVLAARPESEVCDPVQTVDLAAKHKHRQQELEDVRSELQRGREQLARARARDASWDQRLQGETAKAARLRSEIKILRRKIDHHGEVAMPVDQSQRIHELAQDLEALGEAETALRRLLALRAGRVRELEAQVIELEGLVPKGRRKKKVVPPVPALADGFRLPHLAASFYKSLEGKDRRSVERALQAIMLFSTEGPTYPGLEVKQLEGMELWSLRASLKLRVFFRLRDDGDADFLALADREDQHTILRRFKEK